MRLRTLRDFEAYERTVDNRNPPEPEEDTMESQAPYGNGIPEPLSHLYAVSRDAVQPQFFTLRTISGEEFRVYSPELARAIDDEEAKRFEGHPVQEGEA